MAPPKFLYKYRTFSPNVIEQLCADLLYFADPSTFNDPLDTKPCLQQDSSTDVLEKTFQKLVSTRKDHELKAAAAAIRYRGPKTIAQIEKLTANYTDGILSEARHMASHPDYDGPYEKDLGWVLTQELETELLRQYDKGVLSLSTRYDCPLMWSHYGDQHRGLCIGYEVPAGGHPDLHKVAYGGARTVLTSDVASMVLEENAEAQKRVDSAVLLRKAYDWRYEKEWRMIGRKGLVDAPLNMTEIVFGMRCPSAVKFAVTQALKKRSVEFYEMFPLQGTFKLKRMATEVGELEASYPRNFKALMEVFSPIDGCEAQDDAPSS